MSKLFLALLAPLISWAGITDNALVPTASTALQPLEFTTQLRNESAATVWFPAAVTNAHNNPIAKSATELDSSTEQRVQKYPNDGTRWVHEFKRWILSVPDGAHKKIEFHSPDCGTRAERQQHFTTIVGRVTTEDGSVCDDYQEHPEWYTYVLHHSMHKKEQIPQDPGLILINQEMHTISHVEQALVRYRRSPILGCKIADLEQPYEFPQQTDTTISNVRYRLWTVRAGHQVLDGSYRIISAAQETESPLLYVKEGILYLTKSELLVIERVNDYEHRRSIIHVVTPTQHYITPEFYCIAGTPHLADGLYGLQLWDGHEGQLTPLTNNLEIAAEPIGFRRFTRTIELQEPITIAERIARWRYSSLGSLAFADMHLSAQENEILIEALASGNYRYQKFTFNEVTGITPELIHAIIDPRLHNSLSITRSETWKDHYIAKAFEVRIDDKELYLSSLFHHTDEELAIIKMICSQQLLQDIQVFAQWPRVVKIELAHLYMIDSELLQLLLPIAEQVATKFRLTHYTMSDEQDALAFLKRLQQSPLIQSQPSKKVGIDIAYPASGRVLAIHIGSSHQHYFLYDQLITKDCDVRALYAQVMSSEKL